ncbi:hypothetical protein DK37_10150, partial [Halomonas sp. SUBG004]
QGEQFFLRGQSQGKVVRTPLLSLTETRRSGGRFFFYVAVIILRQSTFFCSVVSPIVPNCAWVWWWRRPSLGDRDESVLGELRDLSQDGCQLELPLAASGVLAETDAPLKIALTFPNGTYFEVHAVARHQKPTLSVTYCALASVLQAARPNKSARFGTSSARSSAKRRVIKR